MTSHNKKKGVGVGMRVKPDLINGRLAPGWRFNGHKQKHIPAKTWDVC